MDTTNKQSLPPIGEKSKQLLEEQLFSILHSLDPLSKRADYIGDIAGLRSDIKILQEQQEQEKSTRNQASASKEPESESDSDSDSDSDSEAEKP